MAFMTAAAPPEEPQTYFYIGQHESARDTPVSSILLGQAQGAGVGVSLALYAVMSARLGC